MKHLLSLLRPLSLASAIGVTVLLTAPSVCVAQDVVTIAYDLPGSLNANLLSPQAISAAPRECVIDFTSNAQSIRVVMESPDGAVNYIDRVFPLQVQAFPDSTFVYGQPGAWSIGLGQFTAVSEFRVRLLNPMSPGLGTAVAQGSYP